MSATSARRFAGRARRHRTGRLLLLLAALLLVGAAAGLVWLVGWSQVLAVRSVEVRGAPAALAGLAQRSAAIVAGTPLARVDVAAAAGRVAALPDVAAVEVSRSWPRTVVVEVTPRTPVAVLDGGGRLPLVDARGRLFGATLRGPRGLPVLDAPAGESGQQARAAAVEVLAGLPRQLTGRVVRVRAASPADVRLELDGGATVVWGGPEAGERKAAVLAVLLSRQARLYDVSAPDRPAVRP